MKINHLLQKLLLQQNLTDQEATAVFHALLRGQLTATDAKSLLLLLAQKGETPTEVLGCLKAIRRIEPARNTPIPHLMDTCGTGGDQSHSFNISTLSAFVIAACGGKVAKHGNRSISSKCGSSDLMEGLGVNLKASSKTMIQAIKKTGLGYFHAPFHHPSFKRIQPLRKALKVRTLFNLLGPLLNPLCLQAQLIGVAQKPHLKLYEEILKNLKTPRNVMLCHSQDGMDEISIFASTNITVIKNGRSSKQRIHPSSFVRHRLSRNKISGGSIRQNIHQALNLLSGKGEDSLKTIIALNAGAGLTVSGLAKNFQEGFKKARAVLETTKGYQVLIELKKITRT